ncbi:hypothetical protein [Kosakonia sacchari]|uniref:hypothetical protein n=1 Tax=Kosakonia sacchari TaxID=1158459 RepID=UPI001584C753|nr:hypothetical protein [Kosakonia sacchari]NUL35060.1 hypothetical protein [Kosakonia sacchari]
MSENNYGAMMMKAPLSATDNIDTITAPGIYNVAAGNPTAPNQSGGVLIISPGPLVVRHFYSFDLVTQATSADASGSWTAWNANFNGSYFPTPAQVGAVAKTGDTMTGQLAINADNEGLRLRKINDADGSYIRSTNSDNSQNWYIGNGTANDYTAAFGNYRAGSQFVLSADGNVFVSPAAGKSVNFTGNTGVTGFLSVSSTVNPGDYSNFDARYIQTAGGVGVSKMVVGGNQIVATHQNGNIIFPPGCFMTGISSSYNDSNWEVQNIWYAQLYQIINGNTIPVDVS